MDFDAEQFMQQAVTRGERVLDGQRPNWRQHVAAHFISLDDDALCILGQLYGDFKTGVQHLAGSNYRVEGMTWAAYHGFDAPPPPAEVTTDQWLATRHHRYDYLSNLWRTRLAPISGGEVEIRH
jgi:hypothetical protein